MMGLISVSSGLWNPFVCQPCLCLELFYAWMAQNLMPIKVLLSLRLLV